MGRHKKTVSDYLGGIQEAEDGGKVYIPNDKINEAMKALTPEAFCWWIVLYRSVYVDGKEIEIPESVKEDVFGYFHRSDINRVVAHRKSSVKQKGVPKKATIDRQISALKNKGITNEKGDLIIEISDVSGVPF